MTALVILWLQWLVLATENAFDAMSTTVVLDKGRGVEANGIMADIMGALGHWWWIIKIPVVAFLAFVDWRTGPAFTGVVLPFASTVVQVPLSIVFQFVVIAGYAYVLYNNYKIAWRQ